MENTYDIEFHQSNSNLPKGWEKRMSEKGQPFYVFKTNGRVVYTQLNKPFYEKEENDQDTFLENDDWEKTTNKILKNIIKQGGDRIEINDIENKIYQDNLLHLRNIDANLEETAKIFSIKKYMFNQKLRGRITEKDILNFLRKKRVEE